MLAASLARICFGASVVATRFVVVQTDPASLAFLRYLIASCCLLPVLLRPSRATHVPVASGDLLGIAALGALFFGLFPWTFSAALVDLPSTRVALILATMPLVTLAVSRLRGIERITWPVLTGQCLALAGIALALDQSARLTDPSAHVWRGVALTLATVLCGAIYNVFSRPYLKRYAPRQVTAWSMLAGTAVLAPLAASHGLFTTFPSFTPGGWLALAFLGTFGGAIGFSLWIWALERSTPSRVAVFIALNPVTATFLGSLLLHEPISARFLAGLACVLGGILLANWQRQRSIQPAQT